MNTSIKPLDIEQFIPKRDSLLIEREKTHGDFRITASLSQQMKNVFTSMESYNKLSYVQRECLDMIATKIARIISGDPNHEEHWVDIAGYAKLANENVQPEPGSVTRVKR